VKEATFHLLIGLLHFATFTEQVTLNDSAECARRAEVPYSVSLSQRNRATPSKLLASLCMG